jgi:hypothetical protein
VACLCQKGTIAQVDIVKGVLSINPNDKGGDAIICHSCTKHGTTHEGYFNHSFPTSK